MATSTSGGLGEPRHGQDVDLQTWGVSQVKSETGRIHRRQGETEEKIRPLQAGR